MLRRKRPFESCQRRWIPRLVRVKVMLRQDGLCADCGTGLILTRTVFDHRPPLALRERGDDANDPERLAAICLSCNERKTSRDLKEIAKAKRVASAHQEFLEGMSGKVPGRRVPSRKQREQLRRMLGNSNSVSADRRS